MVTRPPSALAVRRLSLVPGTFRRSPKVATMISGRFERAIAWSISVLSVTQTGQPGPENISMVGGRSCLMPNRCIAWVWVPQNSMILTGFFDTAHILAFSFSTTEGSRKGSLFCIQTCHLFQKLEGFFCLGAVHDAYRVAGVHDDVVAYLCFRGEEYVHAGHVAGKLGICHDAVDLRDERGDCETHKIDSIR